MYYWSASLLLFALSDLHNAMFSKTLPSKEKRRTVLDLGGSIIGGGVVNMIGGINTNPVNVGEAIGGLIGIIIHSRLD